MLVVERKKDKEVSAPNPLVQPLLEEFGDVFPNDLPPNLPPIRGIEHHINLIPKALLLDKVIYRFNLMKINELQRQVDKLIVRDFVRESMSPCSILTLLVPKKNETIGCLLMVGS